MAVIAKIKVFRDAISNMLPPSSGKAAICLTCCYPFTEAGGGTCVQVQQ